MAKYLTLVLSCAMCFSVCSCMFLSKSESERADVKEMDAPVYRDLAYTAIELMQGKKLNVGTSATDLVIGGGAMAYTSDIVFPATAGFLATACKVSLVSPSADVLKVDTNLAGGTRTFNLGGKAYTFALSKVFHFEEENENAAKTNNITISQTGSPEVRWDEPRDSGAWNDGSKNNWQDSKTGSGKAHVLAMELGNGKSVTVSIPMSVIGDFDYVEFSTQTFTGGASTITIKNSVGDDGKLIYKPYTGSNNGIGFGDWEKENNRDFLPVLGNGSIDNYYNTNETFVVAGAWNSKDNDDAILFMQNANSGAGDAAATLENQAAVLLKRTDRSRLYSSENGANFEFTVTAPDDKPHYFDYIAFYKLQ